MDTGIVKLKPGKQGVIKDKVATELNAYISRVNNRG